MMTAVKDDVRSLVDAVDVAPDVDAGQRATVHGLAGELLEQVEQTEGLDLQAFLSVGASLAAGCERPETPARNCSCDESAWFDEVGIRERERDDESRETEHFNRSREIGEGIGRCGEAITTIVSTAETAVRELLAPAKRMLDIVMNCGITQLVQQAVDVVIEALRCAGETASDRNCVIRECLGEVATKTEAAADARPAPAVEFGAEGSSPCDVATRPASATGGGANATAGVELTLEATLRIEPCSFIGTLGAAGAAAALGALECITAAQQECPPPEPVPEPTPEPEPEPAPECEPEPAPEAEPAPPPPTTPVDDGVIAPPPELAQVEEPAPPPKKLENLGTLPAQTGGAGAETVPETVPETVTETRAGAGAEPWSMKKAGEW